MGQRLESVILSNHTFMSVVIMGASRSKNIADKPHVTKWFQSFPHSALLFEPILAFMRDNYTGDYEGYINLEKHPQYRFNSLSDKSYGQYIVINARKSFTSVRISLKNIEIDNSREWPIIHLWKKSVQEPYALFRISSFSDLKLVYEFMRLHKLTSFKRPSKKHFLSFKHSFPDDGPTIIRTTQEGKVIVNQHHLELSDKFVTWAGKHGYSRVNKEVYLSATKDRIDMTLETRSKSIIAEIKIAATARHAIRQAIGQLLDYCFNPSHNVNYDELWIIIEDQLDGNDKKFVDDLNAHLSLILRVFSNADKTFKMHPKL